MFNLEMCKWIFYKKRLIQSEKANISVANHALNFGTAVFETLRLFKSEEDTLILGLKEHMERFLNSINSIGLSPINIEDVESALFKFIEKNNLKEGYIRIIAFPDGICNSLDFADLATEFAIFGWHINGPRFLTPISLNLSYLKQANALDILPSAKICGLCVMDSVFEKNAKYLGYDTTLFLNEKGTVSGVAGANIFLVKKHQIYTPIINNSIYGITACVLSDIAEYLGIKVIKTDITIEDLFAAEEVFVAGTFYGIALVKKIDRIAFSQPKGSITSSLIRKFEEIIVDTDDPLSKKWLSRLNKKIKVKQTTKFTIREAELEDEDFVIFGTKELIKELRNSDSIPEIEGIENEYKRIMNSSNNDKVFIAISDKEEKSGFISISENFALHCGGKYITIQELWVKPEFRSHGVGTLLIKYIEKYCKNLGIKRIDVGLPNYTFKGYPETHDFYLRNEYTDIGVRMKKVIG